MQKKEKKARQERHEQLTAMPEATAEFERWIAEQVALVHGDLEPKHRLMAEAVFPFMRATFYRWAQLQPAICPELAKTPQVLAAGYLHVDNFGTGSERL